MPRGDILLVDDDPGFLTALTKVMRKHGYTVTSAANAAGAFEEMQKRTQPFNLVITDLLMPMISGVTLLNAIKTAFPDVQVIVMTAAGDQITQANALRDGAYAFVRKPLEPKEFLDVVERALSPESQRNKTQ